VVAPKTTIRQRQLPLSSFSPLFAWETKSDSLYPGGCALLTIRVGLCKDYGLTALSRRVYLGNVKKNDLPEPSATIAPPIYGKKG
jgi:hypothetical protein